MEIFRMSNSILFGIVNRFQLTLMKQNTKYHKSIPIEIHVYCAIYKLAHGYNFMIYNEMFTIGKSIVYLIIQEFVVPTNLAFKKLIY
jgi:hypothetical protein